MEQAVSLISTVGFPIAACVFMAFRLEKTIKESTKTLENLASIISENTAIIKMFVKE